MTTYTIEIAVDTHEAEEFRAWLTEQGHTATIGTSTGNYIDGRWTSSDQDASDIMNKLWSAYCNS
ncbi:hypothetical protein D9M71_325310 [compost metagenome]